MNYIEFTKQKISSFLSTVEMVKGLDFPYRHARDAVERIELQTKSLKKDIQNLSESSDKSTAITLCTETHSHITNYSDALGLIARACDVRSPLELRGPFLRLTHKALGIQAKLILSAEWRFSPFTDLYPDQFGNEFVIVGLPIFEADNPLIAPLAGHELGHNIWKLLPPIQGLLTQALYDDVRNQIKNLHSLEFERIFNIKTETLTTQESLIKTEPVDVAVSWANLQCEEMFCDFIGLCIFRESYLHAFSYLLSPGIESLRNPSYPNMQDRVNALMHAATDMKITAPSTIKEDIVTEAHPTEPSQQLLLRLSDSAAKKQIPSLIKIAKNFCEKKGLVPIDEANIKHILNHFKKLVPATGAKDLSSILNASWLLYLDPNREWLSKYEELKQEDRRTQLIKDLTLKSFEILEIEKLQEAK